MNMREENQQHPHAKRNFDSAKQIIQFYAFPAHSRPGEWVVKICDYDPLTNLIKEYKYIGFHGDHNGKRHGFNISFHQKSDEFDAEFGKVLGMLVSCGYIEKRRESLV